MIKVGEQTGQFIMISKIQSFGQLSLLRRKRRQLDKLIRKNKEKTKFNMKFCCPSKKKKPNFSTLRTKKQKQNEHNPCTGYNKESTKSSLNDMIANRAVKKESSISNSNAKTVKCGDEGYLKKVILSSDTSQGVLEDESLEVMYEDVDEDILSDCDDITECAEDDKRNEEDKGRTEKRDSSSDVVGYGGVGELKEVVNEEDIWGEYVERPALLTNTTVIAQSLMSQVVSGSGENVDYELVVENPTVITTMAKYTPYPTSPKIEVGYLTQVTLTCSKYVVGNSDVQDTSSRIEDLISCIGANESEGDKEHRVGHGKKEMSSSDKSWNVYSCNEDGFGETDVCVQVLFDGMRDLIGVGDDKDLLGDRYVLTDCTEDIKRSKDEKGRTGKKEPVSNAQCYGEVGDFKGLIDEEDLLRCDVELASLLTIPTVITESLLSQVVSTGRENVDYGPLVENTTDINSMAKNSPAPTCPKVENCTQSTPAFLPTSQVSIAHSEYYTNRAIQQSVSLGINEVRESCLKYMLGSRAVQDTSSRIDEFILCSVKSDKEDREGCIKNVMLSRDTSADVNSEDTAEFGEAGDLSGVGDDEDPMGDSYVFYDCTEDVKRSIEDKAGTQKKELSSYAVCCAVVGDLKGLDIPTLLTIPTVITPSKMLPTRGDNLDYDIVVKNPTDITTATKYSNAPTSPKVEVGVLAQSTLASLLTTHVPIAKRENYKLHHGCCKSQITSKQVIKKSVFYLIIEILI